MREGETFWDGTAKRVRLDGRVRMGEEHSSHIGRLNRHLTRERRFGAKRAMRRLGKAPELLESS